MVPMKELANVCTNLGFEHVRTYINSGNVLFRSSLPEKKLRAELEKALAARWRPITVVVLTVSELERIVEKNPFVAAKLAQLGVMLTNDVLNPALAAEFSTPGREEWLVAGRVVYIRFPDGMGRSKLKWPSALKDGTIRNLNTLSKLVQLAQSAQL